MGISFYIKTHKTIRKLIEVCVGLYVSYVYLEQVNGESSPQEIARETPRGSRALSRL